MKAAVLHAFGDTPHYEDFPDPVVGDDEILIRVKAVQNRPKWYHTHIKKWCFY